MTEAQTALARRVVACKGWRWMPGMRTVYMASCDDYEPGQAFRRTDFLECVEPYKDPRHFHNGIVWYDCRDHGLPDLTDPATLGCLLALVRAAWGGDFEQVWLEWYPPLSRWGVQGGHAGARSVLLASGATEAEALVAALEAAP